MYNNGEMVLRIACVYFFERVSAFVAWNIPIFRVVKFII